MRIVQPKRSGQEFFHDRGLQVVIRTVEQEANLAEQFLIRWEGMGTGLGRFHAVIHVRLWFILATQKLYQLIACWSKECANVRG
jgi:hypothetical protein